MILITRVECDLRSLVPQTQRLVMSGFGEISAGPRYTGGRPTDFPLPRRSLYPFRKGLGMPIRVKCRSCSKALAVKDSAAGKTLKCPECGEPIRVPRPKPAVEEYEEYDEYDDGEYEAPQPRRRSPARKSSRSGA